MHKRLIGLLACPKCPKSDLVLNDIREAAEDEVIDGDLTCNSCQTIYPVVRGIPRFVPPQNYAASFGYQWNTFQREQLDSNTKARLSEQRLLNETGWAKEWFKDKWILDAGCGAGRFLEVAAHYGAQIVGVDLSLSVDGVKIGLAQYKNLHLVQGSIFDLPFKPGVFDACYCIGVLQHTPDPLRATASLPKVVKPGGRLAVTIYERRQFTMLNAKYVARAVTRFLPNRLLLQVIRGVMPVVFPLTSVLYRLPIVGKFFRFIIPVANYVEMKELSLAQRYQLAILDTFDMLAPAYDIPQKEQPVRHVLQEKGVANIKRLQNPGLNLTGERTTF